MSVVISPKVSSPNSKAGVLNEEAAETKAAAEAEEAGEELDANGTPKTEEPNATGAGIKVKVTTMPVENKPKTGTPAKTTPKEATDGRTRRIENQPQPKP